MQGWRKRMEDSHISDLSVGPSSKLHTFGVFDGHGGIDCADFLRDNLDWMKKAGNW